MLIEHCIYSTREVDSQKGNYFPILRGYNNPNTTHHSRACMSFFNNVFTSKWSFVRSHVDHNKVRGSLWKRKYFPIKIIKNDMLLQFSKQIITGCHADKGCYAKQFLWIGKPYKSETEHIWSCGKGKFRLPGTRISSVFKIMGEPQHPSPNTVQANV